MGGSLKSASDNFAEKWKIPEYHPDELAVHRFARQMRIKLEQKRSQGYSGWDDPTLCPMDRLWEMLRSHVEKGDPVDIGNFAMMIHQRMEAGNG